MSIFRTAHRIISINDLRKLPRCEQDMDYPVVAMFVGTLTIGAIITT